MGLGFELAGVFQGVNPRKILGYPRPRDGFKDTGVGFKGCHHPGVTSEVPDIGGNFITEKFRNWGFFWDGLPREVGVGVTWRRLRTDWTWHSVTKHHPGWTWMISEILSNLSRPGILRSRKGTRG